MKKKIFFICCSLSLFSFKNGIAINVPDKHYFKDIQYRPEITCINFLKWYVQSPLRKYKRHFFLAGSTKIQNQPYEVNFAALKKYKLGLKKSGYVSNALLESIDIEYDSAANFLKIHPQTDGPVIGFENDPIIQIDEEGLLTNNLSHLRVLTKKWEDDYYYISIKVNSYLTYIFFLSYTDKKWKIDSISTRFERS